MDCPFNENDLPKGTKNLPTMFVIKRKYLTDENKNEVFDKWKARLVLRGDLQKKNVDVFNLFSATLFFPAIRLMLSLSTDLTMSVEFYDLMSAFLVPKLEGSFIVMRMPPNEDGSHGQVLALLMAMYGLKDAPAAFLCALGDQMASFTYDVKHEPVNKEAQRRKKKFELGNVGSRDPTDSREGQCSQLLSDHCIWIYRKGDILMLILHYVDDMIISSVER